MPAPDLRRLNAAALRALAWLLPAFALWWLLVTPVILPVVHQSAAWLLASSFDKIQARLAVQTHGELHISTHLLMEKQPDNPNKRHLLNLKVTHNFQTMTLGLPLLWALLLAIPHRRIRNLALGSGVLLVAFCLLAWLALSLDIFKVLADGKLHYLYISANIIHRLDPFPLWLLELLTTLYPLLLYGVALLLPAGLVYVLNRQWWQRP